MPQFKVLNRFAEIRKEESIHHLSIKLERVVLNQVEKLHLNESWVHDRSNKVWSIDLIGQKL